MSGRPVIQEAAAFCGCFGKLPEAGDFLRVGLPGPVATRLDDWLQQELQAFIAEAEDDWETRFSHAPPWRFILSQGAVNECAAAGVISPSRDRVGRAFPCLVIAALDQLTIEAALSCTPWFDEVERLLVAAVAPAAEPSGLAARLAALGSPQAGDGATLVMHLRSNDDALFIEVGEALDVRAPTLEAVLQTTPLTAGVSLWWRHTDHGARLILSRGLPRGTAFGAILFPPSPAALHTSAPPELVHND